MASQSGKTTSSVNFRSVPEVRPDTILRGLAANTPVEVTGEQGEWYTVIVEQIMGFNTDIVTALFDSLTRRDLDALIALYHADAAHVTPNRTVQGTNLVRDFYLDLLSRLGDAKFSVSSVQDAAPTKIITWTAHSSNGNISDGQDTLSVAGGKIQYHFTKFSIA